MSNKLELLHPTLQVKYKKLEKLAFDRFKIRIKVTQTLRTAAEQLALWSKGRLPLTEVNRLMLAANMAPIGVKDNIIVTNAKFAESTFHGYGFAFDIVILLTDGKHITYDPHADTNNDGIDDWDQIGSLADECGLEWGGNFTSISDKPHYQDRMGWNIASLKKAGVLAGTTYSGSVYKVA